MERRVWVIERDGKPVACGTGEAPTGYVGTTVTWYEPRASTDWLDALRALATLLRATGDIARVRAYEARTREPFSAILAGRADGFALSADWITALATELATGTDRGGTLALATVALAPPAGKPTAEPR